ncbi:MAG: hypothetical protein FWG24_00925 [Eggerthellaceae bacterium]|jgi:hypothetical protein|nr:hypothetical protein [Eggerthellaceae bacterium]
MKNFKRIPYPTQGSSALESKHLENIVSFPAFFDSEESSASEFGSQSRFTERLLVSVLETPSVQDLRYGSLRGKSFNKAKPWQTVAIGSCLFALSLAFIFVGNSAIL